MYFQNYLACEQAPKWGIGLGEEGGERKGGSLWTLF